MTGVIAFVFWLAGWCTPFAIPLRLIARASGVMFAIFMILDPFSEEFADRRLSQWRGPGFCERCGYDLRASPDRCPECGTPVAR